MDPQPPFDPQQMPVPPVDYFNNADARSRMNFGRMRESFTAINSPVARLLFFQAVIILAGMGLAWGLLTLIFSLVNIWVFIVAMLGMLGAIWWMGKLKERQEILAASGHCTKCGTKLGEPPGVCPYCGRDGQLDEPTWRKLRREQRARLEAVNAAAHSVASGAATPGRVQVRTVTETAPQPVLPLPPGTDPPMKALPRPKRKKVEIDTDPIPLE